MVDWIIFVQKQCKLFLSFIEFIAIISHAI
jgi:hypothetical protein